MSKVFDYLNQRVTEMLDNGIIPWHKPWRGARVQPMNIHGNAYRGINWFLFMLMGHDTPVYLTFNQIKKMGGTIREGEEKSYYPVYFYTYVKKENDDGTEKSFPVFKYYRVWNVESVEGITLPAKVQKMLSVPKADHDPLEQGEAVIKNMPNAPTMNYGGDRACYSPTLDTLKCPKLEQFDTPEDFYLTMFHEMTHSTGHDKRLSRKSVTDAAAFGSHEYSREELVAEMGACMLADACGIDMEGAHIDNSASYIASWAKKIKDEPKLLATAAAQAQKAMDYIMGVKWEKGA